MKKNLLLILSLFILTTGAEAAHITGGEMIYEYLGDGATSTQSRYRITLKLFRDNNCTNCAGMPNSVIIGIFTSGNLFNNYTVQQSNQFEVPVGTFPPCVQNPPVLSYNVAFFTLEVDLPNNTFGYTAAFQTCCRVNPLQNVFNINSGNGTGSTYLVEIPGNMNNSTNSSPQFDMGVSLICHDKSFTLNFSATDPDGDQLTYSFCDAFGGGAAANANTVNPQPPPYNSVPYINGYTSAFPLGNRVTINSQTGIISGIAPPIGKYVVSVCVTESRNGQVLGIHRKDFIVNVADCDFAGASLEPDYYSCADYSKNFFNLNPSTQNNSFYWDFGVPNLDSDTSILAAPSYTFPDTGIYRIKLVVNRGQACTDSAYANVHVFPGFVPGFNSQGICTGFPVNFTDTSSSLYGTVNSWTWNFGDITTNADFSDRQNPSYTYNNNGNNQVQLIVTDTRGCRDTAYKLLSIIDKPLINLAFRDTLICSIDTLQLRATGIGNFSWSPQPGIQQPNTPAPVVNPKVTTKYYVDLDDNGCLNRDSLLVRVVDNVSLVMNPDTTICLTDAVLLGAQTDGLRFNWAPASTLNNNTLLSATARPIQSTTYQLTSSIGNCNTTGNITITTVPYPVSNAGNDTTICFRTFAQLKGSIVGSRFNWSPSVSLQNPGNLVTRAFPFQSTAYVLTVFDDAGCPKPGRDTVLVNVLPELNAFAGNDTSIVSGEPLQLNASGGDFYTWSPPDYLSAPDISNPIARLPGEIEQFRYMVVAGNASGCVDSSYINIKIFNTAPMVFVPTAFTPNGDGLNDILRPVTAGIKEIEYFRIYNRYGQLVFSTNSQYSGWDGTIRGRTQGTNSFVWIVKAIDYLDRPYFQKGLLTLIR